MKWTDAVRRWAGPRGVACAVALVCIPGTGSAYGGPDDVAVVQTSSDLSQRLTPMHDLTFGGLPPLGGPVIHINDALTYQPVSGFGAAMTDSSAWLIQRESSTARHGLLDQLFGADGIRLNFVRVPIGASDFTVGGRPYSYDDMPAGHADTRLTHFSIAHDRAYILPALRAVAAVNPETTFLANPWTPPAWMKTNDSLGNRAGHGLLRASAYRAYAEYFVKFLEAYAQAGIHIAAITPQNEPTNATPYPGLTFAAPNAADWIDGNLLPALRRAHLSPEIYGADGGWGHAAVAYARATVNSRAARDLTGVAWHCYFGTPDQMAGMHDAAPALDQIVDECSPGIIPFPVSELVIAALRNWASRVALWNLALDQYGGPVQLPNSGCLHCLGLAKIDTGSGLVSFNLAFYQLGQASAYIQPGARRIASEHYVNYNYVRAGRDIVSSGLDDVALRNPDGSIVLIAYNTAGAPTRFSVVWHGLSFAYTLPPGTTVSFVWNRS